MFATAAIRFGACRDPDFMGIFQLSRSVFAPSQGAFLDPQTGWNFVCADAVKPFGNSQKGIRNGPEWPVDLAIGLRQVSDIR
jgi:hypothetical protein